MFFFLFSWLENKGFFFVILHFNIFKINSLLEVQHNNWTESILNTS